MLGLSIAAADAAQAPADSRAAVLVLLSKPPDLKLQDPVDASIDIAYLDHGNDTIGTWHLFSRAAVNSASTNYSER